MDCGDDSDGPRAPPPFRDDDEQHLLPSSSSTSLRWSPLSPSSLSHTTTATSAKDLSSTCSSSNATPLSPPSPLSPYPLSAVLHHRRQFHPEGTNAKEGRGGGGGGSHPCMMSLPLLAHHQHPHHSALTRPRFPKRKTSQLPAPPPSSYWSVRSCSCHAALCPPRGRPKSAVVRVLSRLLAGLVVARFVYAVFWMHGTMDHSLRGGDASSTASSSSFLHSQSDAESDSSSAVFLLKHPLLGSARRIITAQADPGSRAESESEFAQRTTTNVQRQELHGRRRERTTPPSYRTGGEESANLAADFRHERHMDAQAVPLPSLRNASSQRMATLCQEAGLSEASYLLVLGVDGVTTSFLLAAARHCGVKQVMLVDPMVPNLRKERLRTLQRHVRALHRREIGLNLDFRIPSDAGEPLKNRWFKGRRITHVVLFQSSSSYGDSYPLLSTLMDESSYALFHMHQSLLAWDQALVRLHSQATPKRKPTPHVMYVSLTGTNAVDGGKGRSRHNRRQRLQQHLAQVLSRAYRAPQPGDQSPARVPTLTHLEIPADAIVGPYCSDALSTLSEESRVMYVTEATLAVFEALAASRQQSSRSAGVLVWKTSFERDETISFANWTMLQNAALNADAKNRSSPLIHDPNTQDWISFAARHDMQWRSPLAFVNGKPTASSVSPVSVDVASTLPIALSNDLLEMTSATFPCASSCRSNVKTANVCQPSAWELLRPLSRKATAGCMYVTYLAILDPDLDELPEPSSGRDKSLCRVAFVHASSRLVQKEAVSKWKKERKDATNDTKPVLDQWNGRIETNQWTLLWLNTTKELSLADEALLKIDPSRMFADSVKRTLYAEYFDYVKPSDATLARVIRNVDRNGLPWRRQIERRSGVPAISRWTHLEPEPAKRSILFATEPLDMPKSISDFVRKARGVFFPASQLLYYEQLAHAVQVNDFRPESEVRSTVYESFPLEWVSTSALIHDLVSPQAQELRCRWYDEYLHWGGSRGAEELSLSMVLATMRIGGELGLPVSASVDEPHHDVSWYPILNATDGTRQSAELNDRGDAQEFFVRVMRHRRKT